MWPFNRRKKSDNTDSVPPEVQEYYQTERRERVGVAWLLAVGTLLITMALALALFFGGRWVYRTVRNNHDKKTTGTSQTTQQSPQAADTGNTPSAGSPSSTAPATATPPVPASTAQTPAATPTTAATTPQTTSQLTNTGPGDTIAIFFAVSLLGTIGHQIYTRRKLTN